MSRPLRLLYPGAVYHVMNRGAARQVVFAEASDYEAFIVLLSEVHARWGVEILAYSLMKNHYHLCVRTPEGNLPRVMRHVNGVYTQQWNRARGRDGPLFRGRYKALVVEASQYLTAVIRYIHLNPVKAKVVPTPEAYPWSSHGAYLQRKRPPAWLAVQEGLRAFGSRRAFQEYVLAGNDEALEAFYGAARHSPVLGGEAFRDWVGETSKSLSAEHPRRERHVVRPSKKRVVQTVAAVYGVTEASIVARRAGPRGEPRQVAIYLVARLSDLTLQRTAEYFGLASYGGASAACAHVRGQRRTDKKFRTRLDRLEKMILQKQT